MVSTLQGAVLVGASTWPRESMIASGSKPRTSMNSNWEASVESPPVVACASGNPETPKTNVSPGAMEVGAPVNWLRGTNESTKLTLSPDVPNSKSDGSRATPAVFSSSTPQSPLASMINRLICSDVDHPPGFSARPMSIARMSLLSDRRLGFHVDGACKQLAMIKIRSRGR